jgi:Ca2+-transporting ATPase
LRFDLIQSISPSVIKLVDSSPVNSFHKTVVQVLQATRGRIRYSVEGLYRSKPLQHYLEQHLSKPEPVQSVSANARTGNVLITYAAEWSVDDVTTHLDKLCYQFQQEDHSKFQKSSKGKKKKRDKAAPQGEDQPEKAWHKLDVEAVATEIKTDLESGLSEDTAATQQSKYGPNVLSESRTRSDFSIFIEQFQGLPVALLGGASVLSAATGGLVDAAVILGVVGINAIVGYLTESQSEHIIQSLQQGGEQTA